MDENTQLKRDIERFTNSAPNGLFQAINKLSREYVVERTLPEDIWGKSPQLRSVNPIRKNELESLIRLAEAIRPQLSSISNFPRLVSTSQTSDALKRVRFLDGERIEFRDLPLDGKDLNPKEAMAILNRFEHQFIHEPSAGRAASCFESHVNYALGTADELSVVQLQLISELCKIATERPAPTLFMAHYILQYLHDPEFLRALVTASYWTKYRSVSRIAEKAKEICDVFLASDMNHKILLAGISRSQLALAQELSTLCRDTNKKLSFYWLPRTGESMNLKYIGDANLDIHSIKVSEAKLLKFSLVLVTTKLWTFTENRKFWIFSDREVADQIRDLTVRNRENLGTDPNVPVLAIAGIFKFWPGNFHKYYHDLYINSGRKDNLENIYPLFPKHISAIVHERNLLTRDELISIDENEILSKDRLLEKALGKDERTSQFEDDAFDDLLRSFVSGARVRTGEVKFGEVANFALNDTGGILLRERTYVESSIVKSKNKMSLENQFEHSASSRPLPSGTARLDFTETEVRARLDSLETLFKDKSSLPQSIEEEAYSVLTKFKADTKGIYQNTDAHVIFRYTNALNALSEVALRSGHYFASGELFGKLVDDAFLRSKDLAADFNMPYELDAS